MLHNLSAKMGGEGDDEGEMEIASMWYASMEIRPQTQGGGRHGTPTTHHQ
jgi:hypothetical protein